MVKGSSKSRRESSCKTRGGMMTEEQIIQQLWQCLQSGYTYDEARIHMDAYSNGMTTERKVVVVEKTSNHN